MVAQLMTARESALLGAKLAEARAFAGFAEQQASAKLKSDFTRVAESAAIPAAIGSIISGKRAFLPASAPNISGFYNLAFMRLPVVSVIYSYSYEAQAKSHSPFFALIDSGCLLFSAESNQELLDTVIQAYKISEDRKVLLPSVIQYDLPQAAEAVNIPGDKTVAAFLQKLSIPDRIDAKSPSGIGVPVEEGYAKLKIQQAKALENASDAAVKTLEKWNQKFKRRYNAVDSYMAEDADIVLVTMGVHSSTAKKVVSELREKGKKAGLVRLRSIRPFPTRELAEAVKNAKKIGVADAGISGRSALQKETGMAGPNFVMAKHPSEKDYHEIFAKIEEGTMKTYWVF